MPLPGVAVRVSANLDAVGSQTTTDADGRYALTQPQHTGMAWTFFVNNLQVGRGYPAGSSYRGDLLVHAGTCVARYGVVLDARRLRPIAGASVYLGSNGALTSGDGWYRLEWGCPASGMIGFNTTLLYASHQSYLPAQQVVGRGISGVQRLDWLLEPR